jgi:hypothetical protein
MIGDRTPLRDQRMLNARLGFFRFRGVRAAEAV